MKGQKNEILTRQESLHSSRPNVFYFFTIAHFLKQLPTHIAHIAKAPQANSATKALSKSAIFRHFIIYIISIQLFEQNIVNKTKGLVDNTSIIFFNFEYAVSI